MQDISLHILDIAENSITAGATFISVEICAERSRDLFTVTIGDNGRGMPEELRLRVLDPFSTTRTTRRVGLGLSLLAQSAGETGGDMRIESRENVGTRISATFHPNHIDMRPVGNLTDTFLTLIAGNPDIDFLFVYNNDSSQFILDTREIRSELDGIPINAAPVISAIREQTRMALSAISNGTSANDAVRE